MSWSIEFGAAYDVPAVITGDPRLVDVSWHNDSAPSFIDARMAVLESARNVPTLWAEHPDPAAREIGPDGGRFGVMDADTETTYYHGDDPAAAVAALIAAGDAYWTAPVIAARAMAEIRADITCGRVPADVADFVDLQNYVDANEYGGLTLSGCPLSVTSDADMDTINAATGIVDAWLRDGRKDAK